MKKCGGCGWRWENVDDERRKNADEKMRLSGCHRNDIDTSSVVRKRNLGISTHLALLRAHLLRNLFVFTMYPG